MHLADPRPRDAAGDDGVAALAAFVAASRGLMVLTGAGCSTEAGIPDYRDGDGRWKRPEPIRYQEFVRSEGARRRYWARSMAGWPRMRAAHPAAPHRALARLEAGGRVRRLVTQNVDGLHRRAGSRAVIDLHGTLDAVACLACGARAPRATLQRALERLNPPWAARAAAPAPDGDADLGPGDLDRFRVPACARCGGTLKPTVVFFGENVPRARVDAAFAWLDAADALLVVGSSLSVWSGYRFVRRAREQGKPVAVLNLGRTRADADATLKVARPCGETLAALARDLAAA